MTNETTASQPKSIGDDAQFHTLLSAARDALAEGNRGTSGRLILDRYSEESLRSAVDNFRAPAAQASATIQAAPDDFDAWQKNPYTLVLQKSIAEDYVPRSAGSGVHADDIAVDRFAAAMKQRMAEMRAKGRKGWDNPKKCAIAYLMQSLKAIPLSQPVDVGNYAMMLFNRAIWENEGYPNASTIQEPVMVAEPVSKRHDRSPYIFGVKPPVSVSDQLAALAAPMVAEPVGKQAQFDRDIKLAESVRRHIANHCHNKLGVDAARTVNMVELAPIVDRAAPMVADPARVAVQLEGWRGLSKRLIAIIEEMELAATVKAVPSEAPAKRNEQAKFEEWSVKWKYNLRPANEGSADTYMEGETETAWMGWMACVDSFAAPLADKTGGGE